MMNFLNGLLLKKKENRTALDVIGWWEIRRILYNLIIYVSLMFSFAIIDLVINVPSGEDIQEPITIVLFIFLCNLGYTLGWITELFNRNRQNYGSRFFKIGLRFTLFWIMLPAIIHVIWWIKRGFTVYDFN